MIIPYTTSTPVGSLAFIPFMLQANAGSNINVVVSSTTANNAYVSAVITEEG
ncbi:hypothetical protein D3C80_2029760 [compost metagenome]